MANQKNNKNKKTTNNTKANVKQNNKKEIVKEEKKNAPKEAAKKVETKEIKKEIVKEEPKKVKKSFSLTNTQKDIVLVLLVVVLLVVALFVTSNKEPKLDVELPVALEGTTGFNEISYSEYEEKISSKEPFLVIIVKDGCGYCEMYEPIVEEVAGEYNLPINYINLTNLTEEEYNELSSSNSYLKRNQWGTPTTLFMIGDKVVDSIGGYVEKDTFVEFISKNFKVEKDGE